jgi:hypothetical protein
MTQNQTVTATFALLPPEQFSLTVTKAGTGSGTVTGSGINCGTDCTETYDEDTTVTLTPIPATDSTFTGWSGSGCSGTAPCVISMTQNRSVTATFALRRTLTVTKAGTGSGTVTSSPTGITCGTDCTQTYDEGTSVTLTATPATGSTFTGWSGGGCSGTAPCAVSMTQNRSVTATFALRRTLTVTKTGTGSGTVTGSGINCGTDCMQTYDEGTSVTLTATPATGSTFTGWSGGGCSGTAPCVISMTQNRTVTATFTPPVPPTISDIRQRLFLADTICEGLEGRYNRFKIAFDYNDPNGDVAKITGAVMVDFQFFINNDPVGAPGRFDGTPFSIFTGSGSSGSIEGDWCFRFGNTNRLDVTVTLTDRGGNTSNPLTVQIPRPPGAI